MPEEKPLPSDEERADAVAGNHHSQCDPGDPAKGHYGCSYLCDRSERVQAIVALLAEVRAEAVDALREEVDALKQAETDAMGIVQNLEGANAALREENARLANEAEENKVEWYAAVKW